MSDAFDTLKKLMKNKITCTIINYKLFYLKLVDDCLIAFNKNLKLVNTICILSLKEIITTDKYSLILKFYPDKETDLCRQINIRLFSRKQKRIFVENILPIKNDNSSLNLFYKRKLLLIVKTDVHLMGSLFEYFIKYLRKNNSYYIKDAYDLFQPQINNRNKINIKNLLFFFSEQGRLNKIFEIIFYDFNRKLFYFSNEEKSQFLNLHKNKRKLFNMLKNKNKNKNKKMKISLDSPDFNSNNNEGNFNEMVSPRTRQRNIKDFHDKNPNLKDRKIFLPRVTDKNYLFAKSKYDRITFNIFTLGYFGLKDPKVLEITKDFFMIYKRGKNDNVLSYLLNDIKRMDGDSSSNTLNLSISNNEVKKILYLEFTNSYEKYVFKTIVYNHLLCSISQSIRSNEIKLNVNVMTWNVAGIDVPDDLQILFNTNSLEGIDIYTIGVQECSIFKIKDWQKHLKTLMSYYGYEDVASIDMCQMFLIVFVKRQWLPFVENVCSSYKPMGFAKIIGNKGGIIIGFRLMGYQLTFLNCHLAPKPYKVLERNKMAKNLIKYIRICDTFADFDILADYLFWQGDLNYRIDFCFDETVNEIRNNNISLLLAKDQLLRQKQLNNVFHDFQEPEINFFPTYRRKKGTDEYSNKNNQSPSWCDRVMVKTERELDIHYYDSIKNVRHSDHLPVLSKFSIYLTIPSFEDLEKTLNQNVIGKFVYSNINLNYDFTEAFSELDIEPRFPLKIKLGATYYTNKQISECKFVTIKNYEAFAENICFEEMSLNFPLQFVFDLPHARALSIFFIITIQNHKSSYEIGFGKYSLEKIEKENLSLLSHDTKVDITWRTRKFGQLSFSANYKF